MTDTTKVKEELEQIIAGVALNGSYTDAGQVTLSTVVVTNAQQAILTLIDREVLKASDALSKQLGDK